MYSPEKNTVNSANVVPTHELCAILGCNTGVQASQAHYEAGASQAHYGQRDYHPAAAAALVDAVAVAAEAEVPAAAPYPFAPAWYVSR